MDHIKFRKVDLSNIQAKIQPNPNAKHPSTKDYILHSDKLINEINDNIKEINNFSEEVKMEPQIVLKLNIEDECALTESEIRTLEKCDLNIISNNGKKAQIIYSKDTSLKKFKDILNKYRNKVKAKTKVANEELINKIETISQWRKEDRIKFDYSEIKKNSYLDCYLWVFDSKDYTEEKSNEFKKGLSSCENIRITDTYVGKSMCIIRIKIKDKNDMKYLENNPLVFKVDLIRFTERKKDISEDIVSKDIDEIPYDLSNMKDTDVSICVIDSGVYVQHPLFRGIIGEAVDFTGNNDPNDNHGHGTAVASICAYGNIDELKEFRPEFYINSAKIHNGSFEHPMWIVYDLFKKESKNLNSSLEFAVNDYIMDLITLEDLLEYVDVDERPYFLFLNSKYENIYDNLIPNMMKIIVRYFKDNYECKIFNLSQGDLKKIYNDGYVGSWACVLDEIQHEEDVLFVISSGNYDYMDESDDFRNILDDYPRYLLTNNTRIIDPATSITAITVGGISKSSEIDTSDIWFDDKKIISKKNCCSSITRIGPGPMGIIKPDFICYSGDNVVNIRNKKKQRNNGVEKLVFSIGNNIFKYDIGTSFSAPEITHIAGLINKKYRNASSNLIRAIIASSSIYYEEMEDSLKSIEDLDPNLLNENYLRKYKGNFIISKPRIKFNLFGYGMPIKENCLDSLENRVALIADNSGENAIKEEEIHIYEIPLPKKFRQAKGNKRVIVSLAYNPEVKNSRMDYKGSNMDFRLIKGQTIENVINGVTKVDKNSEIKIEDKYTRIIKGMLEIKKGTLQKGVFKFVRDQDFTDNLYLVVERLKGWSKEKQNYAVVVTLESDDEISIYNEIYNKVNNINKNENNEGLLDQRIRMK